MFCWRDVLEDRYRIVGRNITKHVNIDHIDRNGFDLKIENETDSITLV